MKVNAYFSTNCMMHDNFRQLFTEHFRGAVKRVLLTDPYLANCTDEISTKVNETFIRSARYKFVTVPMYNIRGFACLVKVYGWEYPIKCP